MEIVGARILMPLGQIITTTCARVLSPYCGCVVALNHVEKQHLVCLQVAGILSII